MLQDAHLLTLHCTQELLLVLGYNVNPEEFEQIEQRLVLEQERQFAIAHW
jgi:hypothetical protein